MASAHVQIRIVTDDSLIIQMFHLNFVPLTHQIKLRPRLPSPVAVAFVLAVVFLVVV
jgi:hypothetical protein